MAVRITTIHDDMLSSLFGSKLRAKTLGWLFTHTDERFFVRQLTNILKEDSTNISRELARLEKMGVLTLTTSGRQKYYQANSRSPVFNELHGLMIKTAGIADIIRRNLKPSAENIKLAFIFGSLAKKSETRASDIDLMIIGDADYDQVTDGLKQAQETLSREINSVIYPVIEFQEKLRTNQHFLKSVLEEEKIFIIGDNDELARLAK
jgi:uncharacterized protein